MLLVLLNANHYIGLHLNTHRIWNINRNILVRTQIGPSRRENNALGVHSAAGAAARRPAASAHSKLSVSYHRARSALYTHFSHFCIQPLMIIIFSIADARCLAHVTPYFPSFGVADGFVVLVEKKTD